VAESAYETQAELGQDDQVQIPSRAQNPATGVWRVEGLAPLQKDNSLEVHYLFPQSLQAQTASPI
jgi:hypothetical protein